MPTFVTEIDLDAPPRDLELPAHTDGLLALVRRHGRPAGLVRMPGAGSIPGEALARAARAQARQPQSPPLPPVGGAISIVVCTHERPDDLERCLAALTPMAAAGHEVIVVDNAPRTGRTAEVAARFPYRYLVEPRPGLDSARNAGLRAASRPIVAYTDDDAAADPAWAAAIAAPFADPRVGCVTGLVMPLELETPAQEEFEVYCAGRRIFERRTYAAPQTPPAAGGIAGMGANMAVRRDLVLGMGGFDPRLDAGTPTQSGGDTDMYARILDRGRTIVYTPDALVWHRHRREDHELEHCVFGYGVGLFAFLTKRLLELHDLRALEIAARWWLGPLVKAAWARLRGRPATPTPLLLREAAGAFVGPVRYLRTARNR